MLKDALNMADPTSMKHLVSSLKREDRRSEQKQTPSGDIMDIMHKDIFKFAINY